MDAPQRRGSGPAARTAAVARARRSARAAAARAGRRARRRGARRRSARRRPTPARRSPPGGNASRWRNRAAWRSRAGDRRTQRASIVTGRPSAPRQEAALPRDVHVGSRRLDAQEGPIQRSQAISGPRAGCSPRPGPVLPTGGHSRATLESTGGRAGRLLRLLFAGRGRRRHRPQRRRSRAPAARLTPHHPVARGARVRGTRSKNPGGVGDELRAFVAAAAARRPRSGSAPTRRSPGPAARCVTTCAPGPGAHLAPEQHGVAAGRCGPALRPERQLERAAPQASARPFTLVEAALPVAPVARVPGFAPVSAGSRSRSRNWANMRVFGSFHARYVDQPMKRACVVGREALEGVGRAGLVAVLGQVERRASSRCGPIACELASSVLEPVEVAESGRRRARVAGCRAS